MIYEQQYNAIDDDDDDFYCIFFFVFNENEN